MSPRSHERQVGAPNIDLHTFDTKWRRIHPVNDPAYQAEVDGLYRDHPEFDTIQDLIIDKPVWFSAMEADARSFMHTFGFSDLPAMYLVREGSQLRDIGMFEGGHETFALTECLLRYALVRERIAAEIQNQDGQAKATSLLVHELAHLALDTVHYTIQQDSNGEYQNLGHVRSGFAFTDGDKTRGTFFEEGFAAYMTGLYVRKAVGRLSLLSFDTKPIPSIPDCYRIRDYNAGSYSDTITGPDGYALELLMWGCEQRAIMSRKNFFANLLMTRHAETCAPAMRKIIGAMHRLDPNMYKRLSRLEYSQENWQDGCALVYEAVTGNLWPEANNLTV